MFDHIFGQIYVSRVNHESWKPESLAYMKQLMTMLNYFVDMGTNTNYDCFNTYLGKYYNKTKLDCVE